MNLKITVLMIGLVLFSSYAYGAVVFSDNFNRAASLDLGGPWIKSTATNFVNISNNTMRFNTVPINQQLSFSIPINTTIDQWDFSFKCDNAGGNNRVTMALASDATETVRLGLCRDDVLYYNDGGWTAIGTIFDGVQYNLSLRKINFTNHSYDIYLNNTLLVVADFDQNIDEFDNFKMQTATGGSNMTIDDFRMVNEDPGIILSSEIVPPNSTLIGNSSGIQGFCNGTTTNESVQLGYTYIWWRNQAVYENTTNVGPFTNNLKVNIDTIQQSELSGGDNWTLSCAVYNQSDTTNFKNSTTTLVIDTILDNCTIPNRKQIMNFSIRNEADRSLVTANGTVSILYRLQGSTTNIKNFEMDFVDRNNLTFCGSPNTTTLVGNMLITSVAPTYESNVFQRFNTVLLGNYTQFLLKSAATVNDIRYLVVDSSNNLIEDAIFSIFRTINNNLVLIFQGQTDVSGQVFTTQDQTIEYFYQVNATGFPFKTFTLVPQDTLYTIQLITAATEYTNTSYQGIQYRITPSNTLVNITNTNQTFKFELRGADFDFWGMNISTDLICNPVSCSNISTLNSGGEVTIDLFVNDSETFFISLFYKKLGADRVIYVNDYPYSSGAATRAAKSLLAAIQELKEGTGPGTRVMIAAFIGMIAVITAAAVGVPGGIVVVVSGIITIFLGLPSVGFIHPLLALFIAIATISVGVMMSIQRSG